jgi:hypothetical protein
MKLTKLLVLSILTLIVNLAMAQETKKVCHKEKVKGKETEVCKTIKIHKKLDGTKVPPAKK